MEDAVERGIRAATGKDDKGAMKRYLDALFEYTEQVEKRRSGKLEHSPEKAIDALMERHKDRPYISGQETVLRRSDFAFAEEIGKGSYSTVYRARVIDSSIPQHHWPFIAIKLMKREWMREQNAERDVGREREMLLKVKGHPGFVQLYGEFIDQNVIGLSLSLCSRGDLFSLLPLSHHLTDPSLSLSLIHHITRQLVVSLSLLEEREISFNDVKPENVLWKNNGHFVIGDLGSAREYSDMINRRETDGTERYLPPEFAALLHHSSSDEERETKRERKRETRREREIDYHEYASRGDVWALGVTVYQLITGKLPYFNHTAERESGREKTISFEEELNMENVPEEAKDFVLCCLTEDWKKRPKISDLKNHIYLKNTDWENIFINDGPEISVRKGVKGVSLQRQMSMLHSPILSRTFENCSKNNEEIYMEILKNFKGDTGPYLPPNDLRASRYSGALAEMTVSSLTPFMSNAVGAPARDQYAMMTITGVWPGKGKGHASDMGNQRKFTGITKK